jgi:uncharacterized protein (TIGR03437 family)
MRTPAFLLTALLVPVLLPAQTFPSISDFSKSITILQSGMDVKAIAVDTTGNVYLAGTSTRGFTAATSQIGPRGDVDFFVIKTNAAADQIIYAASIGGSGAETLLGMHVDASGSVYLTGASNSRDLPYTSMVNPLVPIGAIALKLNAAGSALTYAAQLGSSVVALAIDVDSTGSAVIVGTADAQVLATTPGVLKPAPADGAAPGDYMGFILRLTPSGNSLQAATYYGARNKNVEAVSVRANGILILADGNLVLLNSGLSQQISSTAINTVSAKLAFDTTGNIHVSGISTGAAGGFVIKKYSATGLQLLLDKTYPFTTANNVPRIAVAPNGRIVVFGQPSSAAFPTLNASQPCMANIAVPNGIAGLPSQNTGGGLISSGQPIPPDQAVMVLDPSGNSLYSTFTPLFVAHAVIAPSTGRIVTGATETLFTQPTRTQWTGVVRFNADLIPANRVSPSCIVHGASFDVVRVSPGALMTIRGSNLGPSTFTLFTLPGGIVEKVLGGTSVTVEGRPAPMLFSWDKQINFIVPWSTRTDGTPVPLCVTFDGATSCVQVETTAAVTGAFQRGAVTAALNQNGSIHETTNPAAPGSVVQLYMTGFGTVGGSLVDGGVAGATLQLVRGEVTASTEPPPSGGCGLFACAITGGFKNVDVLFAGAAPGLVLGVDQVNIKVPDDMPSGSHTFTISFKPTGATTAILATVQLQIQ